MRDEPIAGGRARDDSGSPYEDGDDDGVSLVIDEDDGEMLQHWAAGEIQRLWRSHRTRRRKTLTVKTTRPSGEVCCACFAPIDGRGPAFETEASEIQLICGPCKAKLQRGLPPGSYTSGVGSPMSKSAASPLPRLSLLVQTEAKYQDQLRLLRQQQELLRQQQQEIELRKKMQADTLALERQLAKQRRREFKQLMERRQAEEARRLQEITSTGETSTTPPTPKSRTKFVPVRPRSVTAAEASNLLEPTQLRRHRIPAPPQRSSDVESAAAKAAELAERAAQEHRRKQKMESLKCYAQDLTPLVHGHKPKKLPLPAPAQQYEASTTGTAAANKKSKLKKHSSNVARKPGKIVQLAPLGHQNNNQQEHEHKAASPALRVAIPRQSYEMYAMDSATAKAAPTPLTAEIKPASWMYELLTNDPVLNASSDADGFSKSPVSLTANSHSRTQLTTLHEDDDEVDNDRRQSAPSTSQRVTLAPLAPTSISSPLSASTVSSTSATTTTTTTTTGSYSSERLASLLQKYNVTIATTGMTHSGVAS